MSTPDLLFAVRNNYFLGAYQHAISEASDLENLDDAAKLERDIFVYRSYIDLGSYEVRLLSGPSRMLPVVAQFAQLGDPLNWAIDRRSPLSDHRKRMVGAQLVINEVSASSPQSLQAVKLLAQYQGGKMAKVRIGSIWWLRCFSTRNQSSSSSARTHQNIDPG